MTGRDLIVYILTNHLENAEIRNGKLMVSGNDFMKDEQVASMDSSVRPAVKEAIDYMNTVRKAGYTAAPDPTDEDEVSDIPYEITPNEFGDIEYEEVELVMFADDVLADGDTYERVEDVDNVVGEDNLQKFGHYEEDRVCVRNDRLKCDYEIIRDERTYEQAYKTMYPYKPYDEYVED